MKATLRLLLVLLFLLAGIYSATPLWLPWVLAGQLPPGWSLEEVDVGWPGLSGIGIRALSLEGGLADTRLSLAANDARVNFRGFKTAVDTLQADLYLATGKDAESASFSLDDIALPVLGIDARLPEFSANQVRLSLYHGPDPLTTVPVVAVLSHLSLVPTAEDGFRLVSDLGLADSPETGGRLEADVRGSRIEVGTRFPAGLDSPAWLTADLRQQASGDAAETSVHVVFDSGLADPRWLGRLLGQGSGGRLSGLSGKLEFTAVLAGSESQQFREASLLAGGLEVIADDATLNIDAEYMAERMGDDVVIGLPEATTIRYRGDSGWFDQILSRALPGLQRSAADNLEISVEIDPVSSVVIQPDGAGFHGDFELGFDTPAERALLHASDFQLGLADFSDPGSITARGSTPLVSFASAPFAYSSGQIDLQAERLSLSGKGSLEFSAAGPGLVQSVTLAIQQPLIRLAGEKDGPPVVARAADVELAAGLSLADGKLSSTGKGALGMAATENPEASADRVELEWAELDLFGLAGDLKTRTQGLAAVYEGEPWSGFDLDITYRLEGGRSVAGTGSVAFGSGPGIPVAFSGNIENKRFSLELPPATLELRQLRAVLRTAKFELPKGVKLDGGYIGLQGNVELDQEISARLLVNGHDLAASLAETSLLAGRFDVQAAYDGSPTAKGPFSIESVALAGGMDVTDIRAELALEDAQTLVLQGVHAEVFGGRLDLPSLRYARALVEPTTLEMANVDLGQILQFIDVDGLEGSGTLQASLPLGSEADGMYVREGTFRAEGPGRLAYRQAGASAGNIGLQALENFHYSNLSGTLDYQPDGAYRIGVRLEGRNPDLYGGHPVALNLTINGLLPELFEAMFITGSFEDAILGTIGIKN